MVRVPAEGLLYGGLRAKAEDACRSARLFDMVCARAQASGGAVGEARSFAAVVLRAFIKESGRPESVGRTG